MTHHLSHHLTLSTHHISDHLHAALFLLHAEPHRPEIERVGLQLVQRIHTQQSVHIVQCRRSQRLCQHRNKMHLERCRSNSKRNGLSSVCRYGSQGLRPSKRKQLHSRTSKVPAVFVIKSRGQIGRASCRERV